MLGAVSLHAQLYCSSAWPRCVTLQVPSYKPAEAFILFENFLANTLNSTTAQTVPVLELPIPLT